MVADRPKSACHQSLELNPSVAASPLERAMPVVVAVNAAELRVELSSAGAGHQLAIG
jgi:hypothetical protein